MDAEFENYLLTTSNPSGVVGVADITELEDFDSERADDTELGLMLGGLALNTRKMKSTELFFQLRIETGSAVARAYFGLGDAS